jgi:hypothetical protein
MTKIHAEFVPQIFVKGVAPNGKEYPLDFIFGEWIATTQSPELFHEMCETSTLTTSQVEAFWKHLGRTDKPPTQLKIFLRPNPDFGKYILMGTAWQFTNHKLNPRGLSKEQVDKSLRDALASGKIKSTGIKFKEGRTQGFTNVQFYTADVIKWLALEHEVRTSVDELMDWDRRTRPDILTEILTGPGRRKKKPPGSGEPRG